MGALTDFIGTSRLVTKEPTLAVLDALYGKSAILFDDVSKIFNMGVSFSVPLLGFQYENPNQATLLKFSWSKDPFLNKEVTSNAYIKEQTTIKLKAYKAINRLDSVVLTYALNEFLIKVLNDYVTAGGMFSILTGWGIIKNCVLEQLDIIPPQDREIGGQGFEFTFARVNVASEAIQKQNAFLASITGGYV